MTKKSEEKDIMNENKEQEMQDQSFGTDNDKSSVSDNQDDKKGEDLNLKLNELNDKYLRLFSEFDNYRKRTLKEKIEYSKMASSDILAALLPVFDDLGRACEMADDTKDEESYAEGIFLIYSKFKSILTQKGVEVIPTVGEDFNTDFHEAISNVPAKSDEEKGKVIEEVEKGYLLHGKVLRFAKVVVAN
ncbi:MAG: nucleotide exchange factor GrpE [Bacteroidetes bacterium]|nr:nucleotide exchange factor GrpE [Bacteroidota bacterium]